ncbi:hypothetical protein JXJ21_03260 [candidate division KSB1 bacterium]|nr:hypothetical protein [candidate division KSB1 bacterium]
MSQKTSSREWNQERVENTLSNLAVSLRMLADVRIRLRQAMIRAGLQSLLEPAVEYIDRVSRNLEQAIAEFSEFWEKAEAEGWFK